MAWRRENLRYRLTSARSIEETGLDSCSYGDGFAYCPTHAVFPASQEICSASSKFNAKPMAIRDGYLARQGSYHDIRFGHSPIPDYEQKQNFVHGILINEDIQGKGGPSGNRQSKTEKKIVRRTSKGGKSGKSSRQLQEEENFFADSRNSGKRTERSYANALPVSYERETKKKGSKAKWLQSNLDLQLTNIGKKMDFESVAKRSSLLNESMEELKNIQYTPVLLDDSSHVGKVQDLVTERQDGILPCSVTTNGVDTVAFPVITPTHRGTSEDHKTMYASTDSLVNDTLPASSTPKFVEPEPKGQLSTPGVPTEDCIDYPPVESLDASSCEGSLTSSQSDIAKDSILPGDTKNLAADGETGRLSDGADVNMISVQSSVPRARSRWRQLKNTVTMANYISANARSSNYDLLEDEGVEGIHHCPMYAKGDAGSMGAAAFEGVKTTTRSRLKGRKGMEGLLVRQDKGLISFMQDFYVACLKLPIAHFLIGILLVPVALGLIFTPLYLLDVNGLSFDGVRDEDLGGSAIASTRLRCCTVLNVFLYALSLSTTFGGSPIVAVSPFCLLVANTHTLMAQFLFVFLSGAVFARMSQPSHPIRCAKKAVIKDDDVTVNLEEDSVEKFKVFAVRLVLGGPTPCELVDTKLCLTFRIFIKLPNGFTFCSTQDLDLVRSEVSYLRYGLMVRHVIDKKSPVYGHTLESLIEGDASFSLTIMGLERSSMQPIFHLEDYFVCDGDVVWDGEYLDFIHINSKGQRVLDHSKIDLLKLSKANLTDTKFVSEEEADSLRKEARQ